VRQISLAALVRNGCGQYAAMPRLSLSVALGNVPQLMISDCLPDYRDPVGKESPWETIPDADRGRICFAQPSWQFLSQGLLPVSLRELTSQWPRRGSVVRNHCARSVQELVSIFP